uniref:Uncharacterized protein n=1 Tax=Anguilla anguilla TaxID=7936 RepID=A0A0E9URX1_ANGAN
MIQCLLKVFRPPHPFHILLPYSPIMK